MCAVVGSCRTVCHATSYVTHVAAPASSCQQSVSLAVIPTSPAAPIQTTYYLAPMCPTSAPAPTHLLHHELAAQCPGRALLHHHRVRHLPGSALVLQHPVHQSQRKAAPEPGVSAPVFGLRGGGTDQRVGLTSGLCGGYAVCWWLGVGVLCEVCNEALVPLANGVLWLKGRMRGGRGFRSGRKRQRPASIQSVLRTAAPP